MAYSPDFPCYISSGNEKTLPACHCGKLLDEGQITCPSCAPAYNAGRLAGLEECEAVVNERADIAEERMNENVAFQERMCEWELVMIEFGSAAKSIRAKRKEVKA